MFGDLMTILQTCRHHRTLMYQLLPLWVQWWMNWMGVVLFLGSLIFAFFGCGSAVASSGDVSHHPGDLS